MFQKITTSTFFYFLFVFSSFSQGIKDSVFNISEVRVKAGKVFIKEEAGMKATKVDSLVLTEKINLSLSELLSENTSVFIKSHGRGALATASFRGTAPSHTQVSWNGININSPMSGMVDFSLIPVYIIDDLNLKHGSASIADQSGGLGGAINIESKVNWNEKIFAKYLQGVGSYKTFDEFLAIGGGCKNFKIKTRLYHNFSENNYTFKNYGIGNIDSEKNEITNPVDRNRNADFTKYGILQEVYYRSNYKNVFSVKYWGQRANRTIPRATSYEGPNNSNLNNQTDSDHKIVLDWKHFSEHAKWIFRTGYSQQKSDYVLKNHVPGFGLLPAIYSESKQQSSLNSALFNYNISNKLSLESSIDFNYHYVVSSDSVKKTGYESQRHELSVFFAIRRNFANRLNLNLMFRQDWVDDGFVPFVPFLGFDYRIFKDANFLLKGNIAKIHHIPSLNALYWQPNGNPDLLPEEGISAELGVEYQKDIGQQVFNTEITAYRSDISSWIIWLPSYQGPWEALNVKRVLSRGVECNASLKGKINEISYHIAGNYAYTSSINYGDPLVWGDESYGKQLVYIPLHSGNAFINLTYKGFYLTYQHNSYSERFTTSSNNITRREWLYPYFMNDLYFGKTLQIKKMKLSAEFKIYNLFNETYRSVLYRPMPGRNYMLILMLSF